MKKIIQTADDEMVKIELRRAYQVPAEELWGRVSNFFDMYWIPAVAETRRLDETPSRVAVIPDGAGEVVEELIEQGHRFHHYRVTQNGPMPLRDFEALIRVEDIDAASSQVVWKATFYPEGVSALEAEQVVTGVFAGGLDRIAEL